jgi:hypothetical protein
MPPTTSGVHKGARQSKAQRHSEARNIVPNSSQLWRLCHGGVVQLSCASSLALDLPPPNITLRTRIAAYVSVHWEQLFPDGLPPASMWDNMGPGADGEPLLLAHWRSRIHPPRIPGAHQQPDA